jgi:hypothetical protein
MNRFSMPRLRHRLRGLLAGGLLLLLAPACSVKKPPERHFYEQHIQPILNNFCVGNTSPCHAIDPETKTALGNLDLSSFDGVQKRKDVLRTYGSYPQPVLLLKALPEASVHIPYFDKQYLSEIRHAGGKPIDPSSEAFFELKRWLDNGANRDGVALPAAVRQGNGPCDPALPPASRRVVIDAAMQATPAFQGFEAIQDRLMTSCAYGSCHSSPQADFYLACPDDAERVQFNYAQAASFVTLAPTPVEQSELLLRPLSPLAGGLSHTGGVFFEDQSDPTWEALRDWARLVQQSPLPVRTKSAGEDFFEKNVMPKLLQRGCAFEACHSPDGFNDFRLRSGGQGFFAPGALRRNYESLLTEFMSLDTVDIKQSRAIKKNIAVTSGGTVHRAGPLLEDMAAIDEPCPATFDPNATNLRAICVFKEWHRIERAAAGATVSPMASGGTLPLAFVSRPMNGDDLLHFDTYAGGADLKLADATLDANGGVTAVGNVRSALGPCAGLAGQDADVRGPEWSYDGSKLVFAARIGAGGGLDLWLLDVGAGTCSRLTTGNGQAVGSAGVRLHNFDPVFAPDGSIVFASTRAGTLTLKTFQPNADLFRVGPNLDFSNPQQMTFLLNAEIGPAFMQDGRVSFTAEKASAEFYQLSGRRINWDLSDYHPLLAQRARSTDTFSMDLQPSVDYEQATEIREALDRNFLLVLSDRNSKGGGGALATFNRSIGPFQADRNEVTFVRSLVIVDPKATGRAGTMGVYRSPFSLPNGEILASYASAVTNPTSDVPRYDLVAVNEQTGVRRMLVPGGVQSLVEAALGYRRSSRLLFTNVLQLVFGGYPDPQLNGGAVMHLPDAPVLATLLGANLRQKRNIASMDKATALRVYEELPPPNMNPGNLMGTEAVYTNRMSLGQAALEADRSLKVMLPTGRPLILELVDGAGKPVFTMTEEHQMNPGEYITPGPPRAVFNAICGGCHGSLSGSELDVAVSPDALTGATVSMSRYLSAKALR